MHGAEVGEVADRAVKSGVARDLKRVLVVDDEAGIRKLFKTILTYAFPGVTIDVAGNGLEAVKEFSNAHHGVILMDLRMPEMDGLQAFGAIQRMCGEKNWEMPPIVFCTGFTPPETVHEVVGDGTYHSLLQKPVDSQQITDAVKDRLAN
jgi:two-component system response regulator AtoC